MRRVFRVFSTAGAVLMRIRARSEAAREKAPRRRFGARTRSRRAWIGALSALGLVVGLGGISAAVVFGAGSSSSSKGSSSAAARARVVRELPSLKTADSNTYLLSDGSREARFYAQSINYRTAQGTWVPIEDQLQQSADGSLHPVSSAVPISLPSSLSSGSVSVGSGESALSLSLVGAGAGQVSTAGSQRTYAGVMPGVSVSYTAAPESVRELMTLESADAPTTYTYNLSYGAGLHPTLETGQVVFRDPAGNVVYTLPAPSVSDASKAGHRRSGSAAHYTLSEDGHTLTLVVSKSWLEDPSRTFPVKIDPDVFFEEATDCAIANKEYANTSLCGERLLVGVEEGTLEVARSLLYFNLASIPRNSQVTQSSLELYFNGESYSESPIEIEAYPLTRSFTNQVTWNSFNGKEHWTTPGGDYEHVEAGRQKVNAGEFNELVEFGFTPLVEKWVQQPTTNHGVLLKASSESVVGEDEFERSCGSPCFDPRLQVVYTPRLGNQEPDMVTGAQLAGGGELTVNVADGNAVLENPDVEYNGEGYETRLTRYYNSQDEGLQGFSFGSGWHLSPGDNTAISSASWDRSVLAQEPGGATLRFDPTPPATESTAFKEVSYKTLKEVEALEGAEVKLAMEAEGKGTLSYSESSAKWLFNEGLPTKIEEPEGVGNTISLRYGEYPPHAQVVSHLEDSHGHAVSIFRESSTDQVPEIEGTGGKVWHYGYSETGELSSYENPEGHKTHYSYGSNKLLDVIEDESGTYVIAYDTSAPARVTSVRRIVNGTVEKAGTEDEITSFEYIAPKSPTCKPETDLGETIVRYRPGGEEGTETYCYSPSGAITAWSGPEEEAEQEEEGTAHVQQVPAETCYKDPEFPPEPGYCGEYDPSPSAEEELEKEAGALSAPLGEVGLALSADLPANHYGIADDNALTAYEKHGYFNIFTNQRFKELHVVTVRKIVPWNLAWEGAHGGNEEATHELKELEEWVNHVKELKKNSKGEAVGEPLISFNPSFCRIVKEEEYWISPLGEAKVPCGTKAEKLMGTKYRAPSVKEYAAAMKAFFANSTLSKVKLFTAWNEPNNKSNPEHNFVEPTNEKLAGKYWRALDRLCEPTKKEVEEAEKLGKKAKPKCLVGAGDFADFYMDKPWNGNKEGRHHFEEYTGEEGMGYPEKAAFWAWHAYTDGEQAGTKLWLHPKEWWGRFKQYLKAVNEVTHFNPHSEVPRIWLTEQGVRFEKQSKRLPAAADGGIARQIMRAYVKDGEYSLTHQSSQIKRFYYYQVRGDPDIGAKGKEVEGRLLWDSGLLFPPAHVKSDNSGEKPGARKIYGIYKYKTIHG